MVIDIFPKMGVASFALLVVSLVTFSVHSQSYAAGTTPETLKTLEAILRTEVLIKESIRQIAEKLSETQTQSAKEELQAKERQLRTELNATRSTFDEIATESDIASLKNQEKPKFDITQEVLLLLEPALKELKRMTYEVRYKSELREKLSIVDERLPEVEAALLRLQVLQQSTDNKALIKALVNREKQWQHQQSLLRSDQQSIQFQLDKLLAKEVSFSESSQEYLSHFFQNRGLFLGIALCVIVLITVLSKLLSKMMQKVIPGFKAKHRSFRVRMLVLMHQLMSFILVIVGPMVVFYFAQDWMLFSLGILILLAAVWTLRSTIPRYWHQIQLFLNIGSVREGERIEIDGLPWLVSQIGFYTLLDNPSAGLHLRLPIADLVGQSSRPVRANEPWFPCRLNDWVILSDGIRAKVIGISKEMIQMVERGGALRTYLMNDFLSLAPHNISTNFRLKEVIGISYDLQKMSTNEIPDILKLSIEKSIAHEGLIDNVNNIRVELNAAGASSLDLVVIIDFNGEVGELYGRLRRSMLRWCVDACTLNNWEIPFQQVVLHQQK